MRMTDFDMRLRLRLSVVDSALSDCLDAIADTWQLQYRRLEPANDRIVYELTHRSLGELGQFNLRGLENGEMSFKVHGPDEVQEKIAAVKAGKSGQEQSELSQTKRRNREQIFQRLMFYMGQDGLLAVEQERWGDLTLDKRDHYIAFDILLETGFKQFVNWLDRHTRNRTPPGQPVGEDDAESRGLVIEQARLVMSKDETWVHL